MKMTIDEAIQKEKKAEMEFLENAKIYAEQLKILSRADLQNRQSITGRLQSG